MNFKSLHLFCGIGGGALGFQQAREEWKGTVGQIETLVGIDSDPEACADFESITGAPAAQMDLFSRKQYRDFHGEDPPEGWEEVMPSDIWRATGGEYPDILFTSPPCKGFSALLPKKSANSRKYQALNQLTVRGIRLCLDAFEDDLPALILLENVPRITKRGAELLRQIITLLEAHGYAVSEGYHDCGEIGGLAQSRKRFLLIARNQKKIPAFVYHPPQREMKTAGEVLGSLPLPGMASGGKMHKLPRLQWKTWIRLALIRSGGDWRDLEQINHEKFRVGFKKSTHTTIYRVSRWDEPARTVTGAHRPNNGAICVADPRVKCRPRSGTYGVLRWDEPAKTVTGSADVHAGTAAVADPRIPEDTEAGTWVVVAEDGTWHRPLTTYELAMLQGFPEKMPGGLPFQLAGNSEARWRERIGNAVPPQAAQAIAETMLRTLMPVSEGAWVMGGTSIWVEPEEIPGESVAIISEERKGQTTQ